MSKSDSQPMTFDEAMTAKIASGEIELPKVEFSAPPKTPAQWEYTTGIVNPGENAEYRLNEFAAAGWRCIGIWPRGEQAELIFERENPEYLRALERERRSKMRRYVRQLSGEPSSNFVSADARRETWRSLDRPE